MVATCTPPIRAASALGVSGPCPGDDVEAVEVDVPERHPGPTVAVESTTARPGLRRLVVEGNDAPLSGGRAVRQGAGGGLPARRRELLDAMRGSTYASVELGRGHR